MKYNHLTIQTLADGTVRIYGDGGMIFECTGENLKIESNIYQKERPNSGEVVIKPIPPKSRLICNACGDITDTGHTSLLCKLTKYIKS